MKSGLFGAEECAFLIIFKFEKIIFENDYNIGKCIINISLIRRNVSVEIHL